MTRKKLLTLATLGGIAAGAWIFDLIGVLLVGFGYIKDDKGVFGPLLVADTIAIIILCVIVSRSTLRKNAPVKNTVDKIIKRHPGCGCPNQKKSTDGHKECDDCADGI